MPGCSFAVLSSSYHSFLFHVSFRLSASPVLPFSPGPFQVFSVQLPVSFSQLPRSSSIHPPFSFSSDRNHPWTSTFAYEPVVPEHRDMQ